MKKAIVHARSGKKKVLAAFQGNLLICCDTRRIKVYQFTDFKRNFISCSKDNAMCNRYFFINVFSLLLDVYNVRKFLT